MSGTAEKSKGTEIAKIVIGTILIAIVYGIVHDMVTAHTEISYFTMFHPHIVNSDSPIVMALLWGVIATWWMGLIIGVVLALVAQLGSRPPMPAKQVLSYLTKTSIGVLVVAMGTLAYGLRAFEGQVLDFQPDPSDTSGRFSAVLLTHNVSYFASGLAALILCFVIVRKRSTIQKSSDSDSS